jgi:ABC-type transporter MlaC component
VLISAILFSAHGDNDTDSQSTTDTENDAYTTDLEGGYPSKNKAIKKAKNLVTEASQKIQDIFTSKQYKKSSDKEKKDALFRLFDTYIDVKTVARIVWPGLKKDIKKHMDAYIAAFKQDFVETYFNMLRGEYKNNVEIDIKTPRIIKRNKKKKSFTLKVDGVFKSEPPINVSWLVWQNKIIDLQVEGASLVSARKAEYRSMARRCMDADGKVDSAKFVSMLAEKNNAQTSEKKTNTPGQ